MEKNLEKSLKRFLKRKVKITLGFIVAFLLMCTGIYSEVINETVEIKKIDNEIVVTPEKEKDIFSVNLSHLKLLCNF